MRCIGCCVESLDGEITVVPEVRNDGHAPCRCRVGVWTRGRAMELFIGHESFLALSNRGALSILDASFKFARASYLVSWSTARMEQRAFGGILCPLRSVRSLRRLDVCICTGASEKRFVKDAASWPWRSVESQNGRGSKEVLGPSVPSRVRAPRSIAPVACSRSDEDAGVGCRERVSRGLPRSVGATSGSLARESDGVRWLLSRGNTTVLEARSVLHADRCAERSAGTPLDTL